MSGVQLLTGCAQKNTARLQRGLTLRRLGWESRAGAGLGPLTAGVPAAQVRAEGQVGGPTRTRRPRTPGLGENGGCSGSSLDTGAPGFRWGMGGTHLPLPLPPGPREFVLYSERRWLRAELCLQTAWTQIPTPPLTVWPLPVTHSLSASVSPSVGGIVTPSRVF